MVTAMACEFPAKTIRNARHPVVYVSDKISIRFIGVSMNYQMDVPPYQNLCDSLKAGY